MGNHPVVLFDGVCNFCNGAINFLIRQDKAGVFRFAPLQGEAGQKLLAQHGLNKNSFDSFVLIENGKVFQRSAAALRIAAKLSWYLQCLQIFRVVPQPLRDGVYNLIARNRYKWFGKKEQCMLPSPDVRSRFLQ